jgi:hypothetical protein
MLYMTVIKASYMPLPVDLQLIDLFKIMESQDGAFV